jgi:acyl carrier protein
MLEVNNDLFSAVLGAVNKVRGTDFDIEVIDIDSFLGGDLGIDSREMLEVWYEIEKALDIKVHDYKKRDKYTVRDVVGACEEALAVTS